ncbi:MAG: hypothetical protein Q9174_001213 [Haloplaca sp. 1 TL-2023]
MLCLQIWWLWLPLRTFAYPAVRDTLREGGSLRNFQLEPQLEPNALLQILADAGRLRTLGPKLDAVLPLLVYEDGRGVPPSENATDKMLVNEIWLRYNGSGVENVTQSAVDEPIDFDWAYPPGLKKHLIEISGFIDPETTDIEVHAAVLGYPTGDIIGNLEKGDVKQDINLFVAKGFWKIFLVRRVPRDEVWIQIDLSLPFKQHLQKKLRMFYLPHRDYAPVQAAQIPPAGVSTA